MNARLKLIMSLLVLMIVSLCLVSSGVMAKEVISIDNNIDKYFDSKNESKFDEDTTIKLITEKVFDVRYKDDSFRVACNETPIWDKVGKTNLTNKGIWTLSFNNEYEIIEGFKICSNLWHNFNDDIQIKKKRVCYEFEENKILKINKLSESILTLFTNSSLDPIVTYEIQSTTCDEYFCNNVKFSDVGVHRDLLDGFLFAYQFEDGNDDWSQNDISTTKYGTPPFVNTKLGTKGINISGNLNNYLEITPKKNTTTASFTVLYRWFQFDDGTDKWVVIGTDIANVAGIRTEYEDDNGQEIIYWSDGSGSALEGAPVSISDQHDTLCTGHAYGGLNDMLHYNGIVPAADYYINDENYVNARSVTFSQVVQIVGKRYSNQYSMPDYIDALIFYDGQLNGSDITKLCNAPYMGEFKTAGTNITINFSTGCNNALNVSFVAIEDTQANIYFKVVGNDSIFSSNTTMIKLDATYCGNNITFVLNGSNISQTPILKTTKVVAFNITEEECTPQLINDTPTAWQNMSICYQNDTYQLNRSIQEYDNNSCGGANSTYWEYNWSSCDECIPSLSNTSKTSWYNLTACNVSGLYSQARNWTEYDSNQCWMDNITNTTYYDYNYTAPCDYCTPVLAIITNSSALYINGTCIDEDSNVSSLWSSEISFVNDCSYDSFCLRWTDSVSFDGSLTVYCNDTDNNVGQASKNVIVDVVPPECVGASSTTRPKGTDFNLNVFCSDDINLTYFSIVCPLYNLSVGDIGMDINKSYSHNFTNLTATFTCNYLISDGFRNVSYSQVITVTSALDNFGIYGIDSCPVDDGLASVIFFLGIGAFLFGLWIVGELVVKFPAFQLMIGIFTIFFGAGIYSCSVYLSAPFILTGIMMFIYEFMR